MSKQYVLDELKKMDCIREGEFVLKSGKKSSYYVDLRKVISYPTVYNNITSLLPEFDNSERVP